MRACADAHASEDVRCGRARAGARKIYYFYEKGIDKRSRWGYNLITNEKSRPCAKNSYSWRFKMKEKRILAMFITSAVTLVASLAVTFGVLVSLADPVVAAGLTRYDFSFNAKVDNSLISERDHTLSLVNDITFQPTSSVVWTDGEVVWTNDNSYEDDVWYNDESISTKVRVAPIKLSNNYEQSIELFVNINWDKSNVLGQYTFVKLYNFATKQFESYEAPFSVILEQGKSVEYLVIVYADDADNLSANRINWGTDYTTVDIEVQNVTASSY